MVLRRKTKICAKYLGPGRLSESPGLGNLYQLLHPNPGPDVTGEKRKNYHLSKPKTSWLAREKASVIMKLRFTLDIDVFF
jgi:hypothetical protein